MPDIDLSDLAADRDGSRPLRGYLASPSGTAPWPALVMIHEIFGLDGVMRGHADRLARLGYLTLAVDLFSAGSAARCLVTTMTTLIRGHGRAFADISAARDYLAGSRDCTGKIGVIGFCMGGGFALLSAGDGYEAAAVNYGQLPRHLDEALGGACPIVASYGGRDPSLRGAASRLDAALERAGVTHDVKEYPAASHAFLNDTEAGPGRCVPCCESPALVRNPSRLKTPGVASNDSSPPTSADNLRLDPPMSTTHWPRGRAHARPR
jgi:carboxymethylenebutenolidase